MRVLLPASLDEALSLLSAGKGEVTPIAGGTDLLVHWPQRFEEHERTYLDLSRLEELRPIRWSDDDLILGGLTTYWDVVQDERIGGRFPLLVEAARRIGSVQIQTRGTWAGNIANASPAADGVPVLMAYDAVVILRSSRGEDEVPLDAFYLDYKVTRRAADQLITGIRLPRRDYSFQVFEKVGSRRAQTISKIGLAITDSQAGWRVVANSMAATVRRCPAVEEILRAGTPIASPSDLLPAIRRDVSPIDDIRSTARYRERVMARLLYHDLKGVCPSFS